MYIRAYFTLDGYECESLTTTFLWRLQGGAASFNYLSKSSTFTLPGVDDAEGFKQTLEAMRIVGLSEDEREAVMQIVACVLHLGNIEFECNDDDEAVPADDASWTALGMASVLLQVGISPTNKRQYWV